MNSAPRQMACQERSGPRRIRLRRASWQRSRARPSPADRTLLSTILLPKPCSVHGPAMSFSPSAVFIRYARKLGNRSHASPPGRTDGAIRVAVTLFLHCSALGAAAKAVRGMRPWARRDSFVARVGTTAPRPVQRPCRCGVTLHLLLILTFSTASAKCQEVSVSRRDSLS
jgi:hypothetical protein